MLHLLKKASAVAKPRANMQTRLMGSGHGHGPAPTGFEAKVRAVLPKDYQIVIATLSFYSTIILLFKLKPSKKAVEAPVVAAPASSANSEIPSLLSDEWAEWSKIAGNYERWEKSLETLGN